ncbi:formate-tetrahydrofolate ligase [Aureococcus anophagefferens]|uniref:Formate-tetrahydrofolate ligase n=1 Tax=Aureococcus anophagefferens TaxID=44056 RepID=A0ABR1FJC7_AURAN
MGNKDVVVGAVAGAAAAYALATYLQVDKPTAAAAAASPRTAAAASSTTTTTDAEVIDGKAIAAQIRGEIKASVGERKDSATYVRMKKKAAAEVGFHSVDVNLPADAGEGDLEAVMRLNADPQIHGILVQLPLPSHVNEAAVLKRISVDKDADGFAALNVGNLDIAAVARGADVVVAAIGKPEFIKGAWLKPGCVVIDVGINAVDDATAKRATALVGDADYGGQKAATTRSARAARRARAPPFEAGTARLTPVPRDIAISQACTPLPLERRRARRRARRAHPLGPAQGQGRRGQGRGAPRGRARGSSSSSAASTRRLGEGKSTTTIGLCQALGKNLGKRAVTTIRQPSQGPTFGIKGGAAGGGYSQVIPMEEFNLHMTGDIHADRRREQSARGRGRRRVFHEATQKDEALFNRLCPLSKKKDAAIKRPLAASQVEIGRGPNEKGMTRDAGPDIAVAPEIMAVLALAADAGDFRTRLGKMCVGRSRADGLHGGAMTIEGTPVLVHAGPFANIAHGNSSVVADKVGLKLVGEDGFVATEAASGADIGGREVLRHQVPRGRPDAQGGDGAVDLADAVVAACASAKDEFTPYDLEDPVKTKVAKICEGIYKAGEVTYSDEAEAQLAAYERQGLGGLPVCIAKTQYSLSTDAKLKGVPEGHTVNAREVRARGRGLPPTTLCGDIMTVPGLPTRPGFVDVDYDHEKHRVLGLF